MKGGGGVVEKGAQFGVAVVAIAVGHALKASKRGKKGEEKEGNDEGNVCLNRGKHVIDTMTMNMIPVKTTSMTIMTTMTIMIAQIIPYIIPQLT